MITIGENLHLKRFEVTRFDNSVLELQSRTNEVKALDFKNIIKIELIGVKNNSGYSGTMEWGMKNPTFLLPTNFCFALLNWFQRQEDDVFYKVTVVDEEQFVVCSSKKIYKKIDILLKG